jgi:hypothetical protein
VQFLCLLCIYNLLIFLLDPRFNSYSKWENFNNVNALCIHPHHEIQMDYQPVSQFIFYERQIRETPLIFHTT